MFNSTEKALHGSRTLIFLVMIFSGCFFLTACSTSAQYTPPRLLAKKRQDNSSAYTRPVIQRAAQSNTIKKEKTKEEVPEVADNEEGIAEPASVTTFENVVKVEDDSGTEVVPGPSMTEGNELPADDSSEEEVSEISELDVVSGSDEGISASPVEIAASLENFQSESDISPGPVEQEKVAEPVSEVSNQELIDSALYYWQASNDFWEQGDLDNAMDSLDQSYEMILKVDDTAEPELLQQKEDLRITISRQVIEVYSSRFTVANGTYKAIPLEMNEHVKKAIDLFKGKQRKFFLESYVRSGRYRPAIVRALKEAGLPEELSWLPLIESGFKLRALSSARALGIWQFIASTGYKFGLKRDAWVDERMNPEKSTRAAVAYLTELHQIFGDWTTALAGYNCGENRVLRNIKAQKVAYLDNFWDLYRKLPSETAFYVPKFLAVLHIVNNPEAHGFELPAVAEELQMETVSITRQVTLKNIAKKIGVPYKELKTMNPELRRGVTPKDPYTINVPYKKAELLLARIDEIPVYVPAVSRYLVHRVRRGESLSGIARRYRASVKSIMRANGLRKRSYIKAGWKLKIPSSRYASSGKRHRGRALAAKVKKTEYLVKRGDSLWKIARQHRVTVNSIKTLNGLKRSRLRAGQVLKIFADRPEAGTAPDLKAAYQVKKGDSPYNIARRHNMGLSDFLTLNKLTAGSTIYPGQTLVVHNKSL